LTGELFNRLLAGELDVAAVFLPEGKTAPPPLLTNIIARDHMEIVQGAAGNVGGDWESLGRAPWVLNPPGCLLRASLIDQMERAGVEPTIGGEIHHNVHFASSTHSVRIWSRAAAGSLYCQERIHRHS